MHRMKRCTFCGAAQSERIRRPDTAASAARTTVGNVAGGIQTPQPLIPSASIPQAPEKRGVRIGLLSAFSVGLVIALGVLIAEQELRLQSDVQMSKNLTHGGFVEVNLTGEAGVFHVSGRIRNSVDVQFTLDSGASVVTIPEELFRRLYSSGLVSDDDLLGEGEYILADGSTIRSVNFRIASITVGDLTVSNVIGTTTPEGSGALLGQSFLRKFKSWHVDNKRNKLILKVDD